VRRRWPIILAVTLLSLPASAEDPTQVDVRVATYAQFFRQSLVPGASGTVADTTTVAPFIGTAFLRLSDVSTPWAKNAVSAELSAWGALGLLSQPIGNNGDGDLTAAWVAYKADGFHLKLGRQVALPGAARFVRFDGLSGGTRVGLIDLDAYAGWVVLPRWNQPRGYYVLGSLGDAVRDPTLVEAQNRVGQFVVGARAGLSVSPAFRGALAFHEQHDNLGVAWRNLSLDLGSTPTEAVSLGARAVFDLLSLKPADLRAFADLRLIEGLPVTVDYSYQAPSLLLTQSSILAAFGGASWHELGAETTWRPLDGLKVTGRGAAQIYEGTHPGARGTVRAQWVPDLDGRWTLVAEYVRVLAPDNGYNHVRLAARWRVTNSVAASIDSGVYVYDLLVRGQKSSATAVASAEWAPMKSLKLLLSGSVTESPFAALDTQVMVRAAWELDGPSAGGGS
jgi:hypothetical protein